MTQRATIFVMSADAVARLTALVQGVDSDPSKLDREAGDKLADEIGGELALRWRMGVVKALMAAPPDPDSVREAYGELVDRYRDDEAALVQFARGDLAQALRDAFGLRGVVDVQHVPVQRRHETSRGSMVMPASSARRTLPEAVLGRSANASMNFGIL